jgi:hypothetical protein
MEYANGRLSISEGYFPTIGRKKKHLTSMKDEKWEVLDRKALRMIRLCLVASMAFQNFKRKDKKGYDEGIG